MSGILDYLENNWSQLLGIDPANAAPAAPPPTQPPGMQAPMSGGALGNPTPVQTVSYAPQNAGPQAPPAPPPPDPRSRDFGPGMTFAQRAAPIQFDLANGATDAQGENYNDFSPSPNLPQPQAAPGGTPPISTGPMPPPRPPGGPVMTADAGGGVPLPVPNSSQISGNPAAAPPPSAMAPGGAPITNTAGGLSGALGLNPNTWSSMIAGVGKGLSAVGAQKPGTFGAQSFAAGAGGGLTGANEQNQKNQAQERQAKNDLFNQQSTFFKDYLAADASDDRRQYQAAQIQFLTARAKAVALGKGSNAWQNTPEGRLATAETRVLQFDTPRRKSIDAAVRGGQLSPEDAKKQYDQLDQQTEQYRQNMYRGMRIDPKDAENIKTLGTQKNPYDAKTMNEDEFNARVPMAGWYKDQNGDIRQRVQPPPNSEMPQQPQQAAPQGVSSYGVSPEDQMAMTPQS